jgi:D-amino acid aminotransferase
VALVWLNGRYLDTRRATVSVFDRGLLHGDGLYDTWRTYDGEPFRVAEHLRRLALGARRLGLPAPGAPDDWIVRSRKLVRASGLDDGALRLTLTRGVSRSAGRGELMPGGPERPTLLLTIRPLPGDLAQRQRDGVAAVLLPYPRVAQAPWGALKLIGHSSSVAGKRDAARRHAAEGLFVTAQGHVTEGATSNLFAVVGRTLVTPPADGQILDGVTRLIVLRLARRAGLTVREAPLPVAQLRRAREVFLTASTIEVTPVVRLDGAPIGGGEPGPVTRLLQDAYQRDVALARARTGRSR